jgi:hypothetical protein
MPDPQPDPQPPDPQPQPVNVHVEVNLPASFAKLRVRLQRLVDLPSIGTIGVRKVTESEYQTSPFPESFQIAPDGRIPYPAVVEEFIEWCLKNSFTEAIDCMSAFLEECRSLAAVVRIGSNTTTVGEWNAEMNSFHRMGFPDKIAHLREEFGIQSQFEEHVVSLNRVRNCLVHRLGIVGAKDVSQDAKLVIKWHALRMIIIDSVTGEESSVAEQKVAKNESKLVARFGPVEKQLSIGDQIRLSPDELFYTMFTFYRFASELLQALGQQIPGGSASSSVADS